MRTRANLLEWAVTAANGVSAGGSESMMVVIYWAARPRSVL